MSSGAVVGRLTEESSSLGGGVHRLSQITPHIYIGSVSVSRDRDTLLAANIKRVLNVSDSGDYFKSDFTYMKETILDAPTTNLTRSFAPIFDFLKEASDAKENVMVHDLFGVSVAPALVIAYLVEEEDVRLWDAHALVRMQRPSVNLHRNYWEQLIEHEKEVRVGSSVRLVVTQVNQMEKFEVFEVAEDERKKKKKKKKKKRSGSASGEPDAKRLKGDAGDSGDGDGGAKKKKKKKKKKKTKGNLVFKDASALQAAAEAEEAAAIAKAHDYKFDVHCW